MRFIETFNQHKLHYLIQNSDKYPLSSTIESKSRIDYLKTIFGTDYNPYKIASRYLKKSKEGKIDVNYRQTENKGRYHAIGGLSLQCMPIEIRHTICNGLYKDIDMKNAAPVILQWLCQSKNIKCKTLSYYINNRDKCLAELGDNRDSSKQIILAMLNGGSKLYKELTRRPEWLIELKAEIKTIHTALAKDKEFKKHVRTREKNGIDDNHEGSYMNILLCRIENDILQVIYDKIGKPELAVLCFDGIMVLQSTQINLVELQQEIYDKLNINIELVEKPMDLGFDISDDIPAYVELSKNTFDFTDTYNYSDYYNQYNNKDIDDVIDDLIDDSKRVIAHCNKGEGFYIKKLDNGCFDVVKKLGTSSFNLKSSDKNKIKIDDILKEHNVSYGDIKCVLDSSLCSANHFNIWSGFQAKRVHSNIESEGFKLMKSFLMECWANNNEEIYNYIVSWFAGLVTNLSSINKVALVMISGQGTGKGTFVEFMNFILRSHNIISVAGVESITGDFNKALEGKRLVNINEMGSTKDEFKANFDKMKNLIDCPTLSINPKGFEKYDINNIANYLLFTNHKDSMIIEADDRRYAIFSMDGAHKNDDSYFSKIRDTCFNQEVANEFYTYLLDFEAVNLNKIPETDLKREMINMSKHSSVKFIDNILEDVGMKDNIFDFTMKNDDKKYVLAKNLYTFYKNWCSENGERNIVSSTKFGMMIKDKLGKSRSKYGNLYYFD